MGYGSERGVSFRRGEKRQFPNKDDNMIWNRRIEVSFLGGI